MKTMATRTVYMEKECFVFILMHTEPILQSQARLLPDPWCKPRFLYQPD